MRNEITLYKKPLFVGLVFLILSFFLIAGGIFLTNISEYPDGGYALCMFGFLFLIASVIIFLVYGALNRKFRKTLTNPLLSYQLTTEQFSKTANNNIADIRSSNNVLLIIMLIFSVVIILSGFFIEDNGYILSIIGLGIAVFLIAAKTVVTSYRTHKIQNGSRLIILSKNGAFICGEFHCWDTPATAIKGIALRESVNTEEIVGYIEIEYTAVSLPSTGIYKCRIPVLSSYLENAAIAVKKIETELKV